MDLIQNQILAIPFAELKYVIKCELKTPLWDSFVWRQSSSLHIVFDGHKCWLLTPQATTYVLILSLETGSLSSCPSFSELYCMDFQIPQTLQFLTGHNSRSFHILPGSFCVFPHPWPLPHLFPSWPQPLSLITSVLGEASLVHAIWVATPQGMRVRTSLSELQAHGWAKINLLSRWFVSTHPPHVPNLSHSWRRIPWMNPGTGSLTLILKRPWVMFHGHRLSKSSLWCFPNPPPSFPLAKPCYVLTTPLPRVWPQSSKSIIIPCVATGLRTWCSTTNCSRSPKCSP